jgi:Mrr restriction endonuclease-like protein
MTFPLRSRIAPELLLLIYSKGGNLYQVNAADTYAPLADKFNLGIQAREMIQDELYKNGRAEPAWNNWVQWVRRDLVDEGYLDALASHGVWRMTSKGVSHAQWLLKLREEVQLKMRAISQQQNRPEARQ